MLLIQSGGLALPACLAVYLARSFATARQLAAQLAQQTERHYLLVAQNEQLEADVQACTEKIGRQNRTLAAQCDELAEQTQLLRSLNEARTRTFTDVTSKLRPPRPAAGAGQPAGG